MPVQLVTLPESSALTRGGRMIIQFQGTGRSITTGTAAVCVLVVKAAIPDGYVQKVSWKGQTETIVFKAAPLEPNEFPSGDGSPAYVDQLAEQFAEYFPFYEDYIVERSDEAILPGIKFSARQTGAKYTFSLGTVPDSAPINFGLALGITADGADPLLRTEYSIYAELWVQKEQTEGLTQADFRKVGDGQMIRTDASGLARWDVGAMLHAELTPDYPNWNLPIAKRAFNSHKKYFVRYAEAWGSPIRTARVKTDVMRHAYFGGVSYEEKASGGFQLINFVRPTTPAQDQALRYGAKTRYVLLDEPQFLTFLNLRTSVKASLEVTLTFSDNTNLVLTNLIPSFDFDANQKWTMPVGIAQLSLLSKVPAGMSLVEYQVRLCQTSTTTYLSAPYRYIVNGRYEPYTRYFAFVNSLGAIDTLPTFGKGSSELTRYFEQADKFLPAFYAVEHGQLIDYNISVQQQLEVSTGFCSQKELDRWQDFYLSATRYHLTDGKALPISVTSKTIKEAKDGDTTFSNVFQFAYLIKDDFYTYVGDADLEGDTPPPLGFIPGGNVTISVPQVINTVDNTVPNVVRQITPEIYDKFVLAANQPSPETLGFLKQNSADALYRPKALKIDYEKDLVNTPTIPVVPEVIIPDFKAVTHQGSVTDLPISSKGYILSKQPVPIQRALGIPAWSANAPDSIALEMMYSEDLRAWLGVCRTILEGVDTGMYAMFRKNANGTIDIVGVKPTIANVAQNGYATPGPLGAAYYEHSQELPLVNYVNNLVAEFYNADLKAFINVKIGVAQLAAIMLGLTPSQDLFNRIREQIQAEIAAGGTGGGGGGLVTSLTYYIEELRCFEEAINGGRDSDGIPLDPAQEKEYFRKLALKMGFEIGPDPDGATTPVVIPKIRRYSARIRQIYADKTASSSVEHIVFGPGENPVLGSTFLRFIAPTERISAEVFGSHGLNVCVGAGTAPAYQPPASAGPAETFTATELWRRRKKAMAPVYKINDVYPSYEKSLGWLVGLVNAFGPNYVKLEPISGLALTNFTDTGIYATELIDGGTGLPGTFRKIYVGPPSGDYRFSARAEGSTVWVSKIVTVARSGSAPAVVNRYPDQVVDQAGDYALAAIAGTFSDADGDTLTYTVGQLDAGGNPTNTMPAGLVFNPSAAKPLTAQTAMVNTSYPMYITARDPDGNTVTTKWLLTVNRRRLTSLALNYPAAVPEGTGAQLSATAGYSDGSTETITVQGFWFMAGPDNIFRGAVITIDNATLGTNGLYTVAKDDVAGNNRTHQVICQYGGMQARGSISVVDNTVVVTNRPPVVSDPMPDVPIRTAARQTFALPDTQFTDPDGDALTLLVTQTDGSPLPAWLSYDYPTRTFTKAEGFSAGSCAVAVKATDSKGLNVTNTFLVVVQVDTPPARKIQSIDFEYVTQNGSSYLLWYVATNFGVEGLQMSISWPTDATYGAQAEGQWLMSPSASDPTYRILRDTPVAITAHFRDTNSPGTPEISFTVNRPTNIRGNAARTRAYTATS